AGHRHGPDRGPHGGGRRHVPPGPFLGSPRLGVPHRAPLGGRHRRARVLLLVRGHAGHHRHRLGRLRHPRRPALPGHRRRHRGRDRTRQRHRPLRHRHLAAGRRRLRDHRLRTGRRVDVRPRQLPGIRPAVTVLRARRGHPGLVRRRGVDEPPAAQPTRPAGPRRRAGTGAQPGPGPARAVREGRGPVSPPPIVDSIEELTAQWYTGVLRDGGVIDPATSVAQADTALFGTGQLGLVARSILRLDPPSDGPASVIVKLPSADANSRALGVAMGAYESEVRFYREILPDVAVTTPRHYWSAVEAGTGRYTLLLEDLSESWETGDVTRGGTLPHAYAAIEQLVGLQAPLWDSPALREQSWLADLARTRMLFDYIPPALEPFRDRFGPRLRPEHLELAERLF